MDYNTNEIATYAMIKEKCNLQSSTSTNECPTKTQIKALGEGITISNESSYDTNECVCIKDVNRTAYEFKWNGLSGTQYTVTFPATGGQHSITGLVSTKNNTFHEYTHTQTTADWLTGLTHSGTTITFTTTTNTSAASRSATITLTQQDSNKTLTAVVTQQGAASTLTVTPTSLTWDADDITAKTITINSNDTWTVTIE